MMAGNDKNNWYSIHYLSIAKYTSAQNCSYLWISSYLLLLKVFPYCIRFSADDLALKSDCVYEYEE